MTDRSPRDQARRHVRQRRAAGIAGLIAGLVCAAAQAAGPLDWQPLPDVPEGPRSLPVVVAAGGPRPRVHVMSGRRRRDGGAANAIDALVDHHAFDPGDFRADQSGGWHRRADLPRPMMAGSGEVRPRWRSPATWRVTTGHTVPAATGR